MRSNSRLISFLFFLLPALLAIVAIVEMSLTSSDPKNSAFLGLSSSRLGLIGFLSLAIIFFVVLAALFWNYSIQMKVWTKEQLEKKTVFVSIFIISILILVSAYLILAVPSEYLHGYYAVHERARPLLAWLCMVSLQITLGLMVWSLAPNLKENLDAGIPYKQILRIGIIIFIVLAGIWIFIGVTKLGVWPGNAFWGKSGVPVLWPQIFLGLVISSTIQFFFIDKLKRPNENAWLDRCVCAIIWLTALILWNNQPFIPGVFTTPPRPPVYQIFPASDSQLYDSAAQNQLIGTPTLWAIDKPLYIAFLALLHLLSGSNYSNLYLLQVTVFALIPVIGYLLGKTLHSRQLGIMFGILLIFREQNAIALTNIIQVSTVKMILSEVLTTLGILLFTFLLVKWLNRPDVMGSRLWIAGGVLGLTGLVRLNALTIVPFVFLLIGLALKFQLKRWLLASLLFITFLVISIIPWSVQSFRMTNDPLAFITAKTNGVIINARYIPAITSEQPAGNGTEPAADTLAGKTEKYLLLGKNITEHYLHNLISMVVMLPPSGSLYQMSDMVIRLPYWKLHWDGELQPDAYLIVLIVLCFFALGISAAWTRLQAAGVAPLLIILGYNISTALSLTSGGRYMVPMDWGVLLYFSIGVIEIKSWLFMSNKPNKDIDETITKDNPASYKINYLLFTKVALMFLSIGFLPTLFRILPSTLYPTATANDFLKLTQTIPEISGMQVQKQISSFLLESSARFEHGRALYPRYYPIYQGESNLVDGPVLTNRNNFNRLTFYLIGTQNISIILPIVDVPSNFSAGADIWVAGCDRGKYLEALFVILQEQGSRRIYQQTPLKMTCQ